MKSTSTNSSHGDVHIHVGHTFAKVLDGRKQPIRGLWIRGARYYAQLTVENPVDGTKRVKRIPLVDKDGDAVGTNNTPINDSSFRLRRPRAMNRC